MKGQLTDDPGIPDLNQVWPDDPRYDALNRRGFYGRVIGRPDYICIVRSAEQVVEAVQDALSENLRVAVRSGGHCLESFVANPEVRVVIDMSMMADISFDVDMSAFAVAPGATLGQLYRTLFIGWGVTLPAGVSPDVGVGGHVLGGGFGFLCREHGLAADHLYAVEVVVVDETGTARIVRASREASDPNRDLWWAHTGGGGGNFGVVTRYWFRSNGVIGSDPCQLLPKAPSSVHRFKAAWAWEHIDEPAFGRLLKNHGRWCEDNSAADSPYAQFYSTLAIGRRKSGKFELTGVTTAMSKGEKLIDAHLAAVQDGVAAPHSREIEKISWLDFALFPFPDLVKQGGRGALFKLKDAFLRRRLGDRQIEAAFRYLTREDFEVVDGTFGMATYGGRTNVVAPDTTASANRESIVTMSCGVGWSDPANEAPSLAWVRQFYRDLFSHAGGVPVPGEQSNGANINHPDIDLADPEWNSSGVPWHFLYYKNNYPRLQKIKSRWDPLNIFRHSLSVGSPPH